MPTKPCPSTVKNRRRTRCSPARSSNWSTRCLKHNVKRSFWLMSKALVPRNRRNPGSAHGYGHEPPCGWPRKTGRNRAGERKIQRSHRSEAMSDFNVLIPPDDEALVAYLDGQLDADEQAMIE